MPSSVTLVRSSTRSGRHVPVGPEGALGSLGPRLRPASRPVRVATSSHPPFNASAAGLVTVLPITSKARAVRTRVEILPPEGGLTQTSYVIGEQTRTVSTGRLVKPLGRVSSATMARVADIVRVLLGL